MTTAGGARGRESAGGAGKDPHAPARPWIPLVAGGAAGGIGVLLTCPFEVVKTHLQGSSSTQMRQSFKRYPVGTRTFRVMSSIFYTDGVRGLFRGVVPTLIGVVPARAIYFSVYSGSKMFFEPIFGPKSPATHALSACTTGVTVSTLMSPVWVVKTRMQLERTVVDRDRAAGLAANVGGLPKPTTLRKTIQQIWVHEGVPGFYRGLVASYIGVLESAIHFVIYEQLKEWRHIARQAGWSTPASGLRSPDTLPEIAFTTTSPLRVPSKGDLEEDMETENDIDQVLNGKKSESEGQTKTSTSSISSPAYSRKSPSSPSSPPSAKAPSSALVSSTSGSRSSPPLGEKKEPKEMLHPLEYLACAGLARVIATVVTYPHEIVRTRMREFVPPGQPRRYGSVGGTFMLVLREEGRAGLYGGLGPHLMRVVPNAMVLFMSFEVIAGFLNRYVTEAEEKKRLGT